MNTQQIADLASYALAAATPEEQEQRIHQVLESLPTTDWSVFIQQCWLVRHNQPEQDEEPNGPVKTKQERQWASSLGPPGA